jgi:hypothetical protein
MRAIQPHIPDVGNADVIKIRIKLVEPCVSLQSSHTSTTCMRSGLANVLAHRVAPIAISGVTAI